MGVIVLKMQAHIFKAFDTESFYFVKIIFRYSKHAESTGENTKKEGGRYEIMSLSSIDFCQVTFSPSALASSSKSWSGEWAGHSL